MLRGVRNRSPELPSAAEEGCRRSTGRPGHAQQQPRCHGDAPRCKETNGTERRERGVLGTPVVHLDGVELRRLAGVVLGRPGGVERVEMGANDRGGAGGLIGGRNGSFYSVVGWIEDGCKWR